MCDFFASMANCRTRLLELTVLVVSELLSFLAERGWRTPVIREWVEKEGTTTIPDLAYRFNDIEHVTRLCPDLWPAWPLASGNAEAFQ